MFLTPPPYFSQQIFYKPCTCTDTPAGLIPSWITNKLSYQVRRALGDFGVPIAIVTMVALDLLVQDTYTEKLRVPEGLQVGRVHYI